MSGDAPRGRRPDGAGPCWRTVVAAKEVRGVIYALNVTNQSVDVQVVDDSGIAVSGLVAATFPALTYSVAGANADVVWPALIDLAAITTAWTNGGLKERGGGVYRLDCPNAMFTT